ncbi:MAG TPA: glycosyltransferase [Bryobacteraceae bacterium]|nr:glycosyltransferase [Bryobacteraceae bacterium]
MMPERRVAFFSDSFHEVNGVALTSRQYEQFARRRGLPFFSLHAGPVTRVEHDGAAVIYELQRSAAAFNLEASSELAFDMLIWRQRQQILAALKDFRPDLLHVTGPGDVGMLGAALAHQLRIPLVASWHTNVHEYAGRRLHRLLSFLPDRPLEAVSQAAERGALTGVAKFYALARLLFAPNQELVDLLRDRTGKPCFLMQRGVDSVKFDPAKRSPGTRPFTIGYVGRLSTEKNVRFLAEIGKALIAAGKTDYRFTVVGPGSDEGWLRQNVQRAEFPGVLKGEELARAYADMDVFVFPSYTDTFGNVILEALASGVPTVVTTGGGPKFLVRSGVTGFVAADDRAFIRCVLDLMNDRELHTRMRQAAREYACSISWDRVFEQVWSTYDAVLFADARAAS